MEQQEPRYDEAVSNYVEKDIVTTDGTSEGKRNSNSSL